MARNTRGPMAHAESPTRPPSVAPSRTRSTRGTYISTLSSQGTHFRSLRIRPPHLPAPCTQAATCITIATYTPYTRAVRLPPNDRRLAPCLCTTHTYACLVTIPRVFIMRLITKHFRRREVPWEVVDSRDVSPVPMWDEDDELEVIRMHDTNILVSVQHELRNVAELRKAVLFARHQLLREASKLHYNVLLMEGWRYTLLRKGHRYRLDVTYSGRPAYATGKVATAQPTSPPPFIGVLDHCRTQMHGFVPAAKA